MYFYAFWAAESESSGKIAPFTIGFRHNLKISYSWVYDGKTWFYYRFQATEFIYRISPVI